MEDHPTQPSPADVFAAMQAAHAAAEAEREKNAKLLERAAAAEAATMQEMIKRMEAEKATLEERNKHLEDAAKAEAAKAEAAKDAAEEDADADGLGEGRGSSKSAAGRCHHQGHEEEQEGRPS